MGLPEQPHPRQITAGERLLDPQHRELVEAVQQLPHVGWAEPGTGVAGHPPPLVEVDHDLEPVAGGGPDRGHDRDAFIEAVASDPDLDRAEAFLDQTQRVVGPGVRGAQLAQRRVRGNPLQRAAQERRHANPEGPPGEVPQRRLERPAPAGVKGDRLERPGVGCELERVATDEQVPVLLEARHRVAAADPAHALVGLDPYNRRPELRARIRIPGRAERGVQWQPQALDLDCGDPHRTSPASVERARE